MLLQVITSVGFIIPPERVTRVKPGNLYVRRTSHGLEFVRKKAKSCGNMDQSEGRRRSSSINREEQQRIWERREDLRAEIDRIEDVQLRNAIRAGDLQDAEERRINDRRARLQEAELVAVERARLQAEEAAVEEEQARLRRLSRQLEPRTPPERRRSSGIYSFVPALHYSAEYQNHQQHARRRTSHHSLHADFVGSPLREYFTVDAFPTTPRQHHRCPHHRQSRGGAPWVCDIVIENERRRSNVAEPWGRRRSTHFFYDVESRSPQDYWYY